MGNEITKSKGAAQYGRPDYEQYLTTAAGRITCLRCTAKSNRTKLQCGKPALKTSRTQKCGHHGGGPQPRVKHGFETLTCPQPWKR